MEGLKTRIPAGNELPGCITSAGLPSMMVMEASEGTMPDVKPVIKPSNFARSLLPEVLFSEVQDWIAATAIITAIRMMSFFMILCLIFDGI